MKKVLVVCFLLGAMLLVDWLAPPHASAAASLAGMGFVMLAAYAVAEIGVALSLPQVTGYIVAGLALGPSVGGIISGELIGEMRMFNTLALGLIATSAGLELDVRQIARLMRTLALTTLIKVVFGVSLVALTLIAIESLLGLLQLGSQAELLTLALVLGVLSIGTSPSITLAVLTETRAKGRLSELVLGAAVFKDLVVVVGLALATALGRVWLSPNAAADSSVLAKVAIELGGSILAGALVGGVFIVYVRFIRAEMLLFIAAMILVVAELCRAFHLELLLVFIASGFVVRNASSYEHELMRPLRLVALPVFVLFFANAGASVDLVTTYEILPIALGLCLVRAAVYYGASQLGGRWSGESRNIRRYAWLAYLPQAGVTLGLVGVASLQLPELAGPITNTGMAVVALNLLIGPVTLRRALAALKEIPRSDPEPAQPEGPSAAGSASAPAALGDSSARPPALLPPALQSAMDALARELSYILDQFDARRDKTLLLLPVVAEPTPELEAFRAIVVARRKEHRELYEALLAPLAALPNQAPFEALPSGQRRWTMSRLLRVRSVPLRHLARIALGPALAQLVARRFEDSLRVPSALLAPGSGNGAPPELSLGLQQLAELLQQVGAGKRRARSLRYSMVEPEVRRSLGSLAQASDLELARLARAAWGTALLETRRSEVCGAAGKVIRHTLVEPARATAARVSPAAMALAASLRDRLGRGGPADAAHVQQEFLALARTTLGDIAREFRLAATVRATLAELVSSTAGCPENIDSLWLQRGAPLLQGKVQAVPFRAHVEALIRHVMPPVELAARSIAAELNQLPRKLEEALQLAEPVPASATERSPAGLRLREWPGTLDQAPLLDAAAATVRAVDHAILSLEASLGSAYAAFGDDLQPGPTRHAQRDERWQRWLERFQRARRRLSLQLGLRSAGAHAQRSPAAIREWLQASNGSSLPPAAERWFELAPVSDERIFAGHHRLLNGVLDADGARAELGRASLLVVGSSGMGKSSLLNLCELELPHTTHLRLHAAEFARDMTLFEAMATLLDCAPTEVALRRQLEERAPALFVDDLPSWVSAGADRGAELERVLQLIAQTHHRAFWVVSVETTMCQVLGELAALEEVFTHELRLQPFSEVEIQHLVESRLELLGESVAFPAGPWAAFADGLSSSSAASRFHRRLWRASRGHPGRALALCRRAFVAEGLALTLRADALESHGDVHFHLTSVQLATLATLRRFGPHSPEWLARELAVSLAELRRSIGFLEAAGLVFPRGSDQSVAIAPAAQWAVQQMLIRARLAVEA